MNLTNLVISSTEQFRKGDMDRCQASLNLAEYLLLEAYGVVTYEKTIGERFKELFRKGAVKDEKNIYFIPELDEDVISGFLAGKYQLHFELINNSMEVAILLFEIGKAKMFGYYFEANKFFKRADQIYQLALDHLEKISKIYEASGSELPIGFISARQNMEEWYFETLTLFRETEEAWIPQEPPTRYQMRGRFS